MAVWPAGGIGLAALLLSRRRLWPVILAALFFAGLSADLLGGRPVFASLGFMTANVAESLGCAWLVSSLCGGNVQFVRVREILALSVAAAAVNAGTALLGAGAGTMEGKTAFGELWLTWWVTDGLGILLVTPVIVSWHNLWGALSGLRWRTVELGFFLGLWFMAARLSFQSSGHLLSLQPYMLVALLAWPGLRFGQRGVTLALTVLAAAVLTSGAASGGPLPWGGGSPNQNLLSAQIFLGFAGFAAMLLAAAYAEARGAEQSSRDDQDRLRALGDNLPNGVVYQVVREIDGSRRFQYVSAGIERLMGVSAEEVLRDSSLLYRMIVEEDRQMMAAAEEVSARELTTFSVVARVRRRDGEIRWMHLTSSPRRLPDGRVLSDGIQTDVTESRRAQEALRESEERYRVLVHNTEMPVVVVSALDSRTLFANGPAAEFLDCSVNEIVGMHIADFWGSGEERERALKLLHEHGRVAGFEARFRPRGGEEKSAKLGVTLIDYGGQKAILAVFTDITQLKELQQKLDSERHFFKTLIQTIPDRVWLKDPQGVFLACNAAFARYLDKGESEIVGKADRDLASEAAVKQFRLHDRQAIAAGGPTVNHEWIVIPGDGRRVLMETIKTPLRDADRQLIGVLGISRDITAARQAEALLRERIALQEQLETTAALLPGALYSLCWQPDGTFSLPYASPVFEGIWGITPEAAALDLPRFASLIHPDDLAHVRQCLAESARTMGEWHQEFRVRHPRKGEIWVEDRSRPVREPDGRVVWHGFQADITARKRAELRAAEEAIRRRIFVEESKDGVAIVDLSGKLREWNRSFAEMLGYDQEEISMLSIWDWDTRTNRETIQAELRTLASTQVTFEACHRRKDGTIFEVEISANSAEIGGEILIFGTHRDITARRLAEKERDQLQQALQETRRLESIAVLAGGMAHEFNNLLTVINGYCALLRGRFRGDSSTSADLSEIQRAGQRAANLTQQLLAYGRQRLIRPRNLDLNSLVEREQPIWRGFLSPDNLVRVELANALRLVKADPDQIFEAVVHLVRNANDAMPDGGTLRIETSNVEIAEELAAQHQGARPGKFVVLKVTDTGTGMDEKTQERIFEPFFTTKERALASGLGLATVHGILAQHQGWIEVESALGQGSSFQLYLPAVDTVDLPEMIPLDGTGNRGEPATVLVVEDQEAVRRLTVSILRGLGYRTLEAKNGSEAIMAAEQCGEPIHLLVTEVVMPGMNGPDLARHLKARMTSMKVIYMSGHPEEVVANYGVRVQDTVFVQKPYKPEELCTKVFEILRR